MFAFAALTYGMLASFVMASVSRNRREARANPPILNLFGWTLMAFSMAMAAMLIGSIGYGTLAGSTVV